MKYGHRQIAVGFLAAILGGIGLGYYFGYDAGWEGAVNAMQQYESSIEAEGQ